MKILDYVSLEDVTKEEKYVENANAYADAMVKFHYLKACFNNLTDKDGLVKGNAPEMEAFENVRPDLVANAKNGDLKSLAVYLNFAEPEDWDAELLKNATTIKSKLEKTPEEWAVVAALHSHDFVEVELSESNYSNNRQKVLMTVSKMKEKFEESHKIYFDHYAFKDTKELWGPHFMDCCNIHKSYSNSEYNAAMTKAALGFYGRFFKYNYITDACQYLDCVDKMLLPPKKSELENLSFNRHFTTEGFAKFTLSEFKKLKKSLASGNNDLILETSDLVAMAQIMVRSPKSNKEGENLFASLVDVDCKCADAKEIVRSK